MFFQEEQAQFTKPHIDLPGKLPGKEIVRLLVDLTKKSLLRNFSITLKLGEVAVHTPAKLLDEDSLEVTGFGLSGICHLDWVIACKKDFWQEPNEGKNLSSLVENISLLLRQKLEKLGLRFSVEPIKDYSNLQEHSDSTGLIIEGKTPQGNISLWYLFPTNFRDLVLEAK